MIPEKNPGEKSSIKSIIFYTYCWLVLIFMIMPNFVVFPISFSKATYLEFPPKEWSLRWYYDYFSREEWIDATIRSFEVAICVTILAVILGSLVPGQKRILARSFSDMNAENDGGENTGRGES